MDFRPGITEAEFDDREVPFQTDVLLHLTLGQQLPARPVPGPDAGVQRGGIVAEFEHFGGMVGIVASLDRIPAPRLLDPKGTIRLAVITLLDQTPMVKVIQQILLGPAAGKPRDSRP
jgi:hypothetical protein